MYVNDVTWAPILTIATYFPDSLRSINRVCQ